MKNKPFSFWNTKPSKIVKTKFNSFFSPKFIQPVNLKSYPVRTKSEIKLIDRNPFGDRDKDKVPNFFDCKPLNKKKQDFGKFRYRSKTNREVESFTAAERFGGANIKRLKKIGSGRDRAVFQLDKDKVIKIAKNIGGIRQNESESDYFINESGFRPKFYEKGKDYVVMEKVDKLSKENKRKMRMISRKHAQSKHERTDTLEVVKQLNENFPSKEYPYSPKDPGFGKSVTNNYVFNDLANYNLSPRDISKPSSWGEKEGKIVLVDAGGLDESVIQGPPYQIKKLKKAYNALSSTNPPHAPSGTMSSMKMEIKDWEDIQRARKQFGKKGFKEEGRGRYDVQPEALKSLPEIGISQKKKTIKPYEFQDTHQERVIHSGWDYGNVYRNVLEGAGDVFRESSANTNPAFVDPEYVMEKITRIKKHIKEVETKGPVWKEDLERLKSLPPTKDKEVLKGRKYFMDLAEEGVKTGIHPEDSFEYAYKFQPHKFKQMEEQWKKQPVKTKLQEKARQLNLAMLKKDFDTAKKIIPEIEESIKTQKTALEPLSETHEHEKRKERMRANYYRTREKQLQYKKERYAIPEIREKILTKQKEYISRPEIREKTLKKHKAYYEKNKERMIEQIRASEKKPGARERRRAREKIYKKNPKVKERMYDLHNQRTNIKRIKELIPNLEIVYNPKEIPSQDIIESSIENDNFAQELIESSETPDEEFTEISYNIPQETPEEKESSKYEKSAQELIDEI